MTPDHHADAGDVLDELLRANGFTEDTLFYRFTRREFLTATGQPGEYRLSANTEPAEAVHDVYGQGHIATAQQIGPGLAFAEQAENQWQDEGRVGVAVRLKDVLAQGGRIYPVESVITERVWYLTMPQGEVLVREVH